MTEPRQCTKTWLESRRLFHELDTFILMPGRGKLFDNQLISLDNFRTLVARAPAARVGCSGSSHGTGNADLTK
jgi:hypothetical protein